jgi:hypothetical protein
MAAHIDAKKKEGYLKRMKSLIGGGMGKTEVIKAIVEESGVNYNSVRSWYIKLTNGKPEIQKFEAMGTNKLEDRLADISKQKDVVVTRLGLAEQEYEKAKLALSVELHQLEDKEKALFADYILNAASNLSGLYDLYNKRKNELNSVVITEDLKSLEQRLDETKNPEEQRTIKFLRDLRILQDTHEIPIFIRDNGLVNFQRFTAMKVVLPMENPKQNPLLELIYKSVKDKCSDCDIECIESGVEDIGGIEYFSICFRDDHIVSKRDEIKKRLAELSTVSEFKGYDRLKFSFVFYPKLNQSLVERAQKVAVRNAREKQQRRVDRIPKDFSYTEVQSVPQGYIKISKVRNNLLEAHASVFGQTKRQNSMDAFIRYQIYHDKVEAIKLEGVEHGGIYVSSKVQDFYWVSVLESADLKNLSLEKAAVVLRVKDPMQIATYISRSDLETGSELSTVSVASLIKYLKEGHNQSR